MKGKVTTRVWDIWTRGILVKKKKSENRPEVGAVPKLTSSDPLPSMRLHLLKVPQLSKTGPPAGNQETKTQTCGKHCTLKHWARRCVPLILVLERPKQQDLEVEASLDEMVTSAYLWVSIYVFVMCACMFMCVGTHVCRCLCLCRPEAQEPSLICLHPVPRAH